MNLAAAAQRKPAKPKKPGAAKPGAKAAAKALEEARHRARLLRAYLLGLLTLVVLACAFIPGQSVWQSAHNGLWGFFGVPLVFWAAFSFYICSVWLRNRPLKSAWLPLLCQALLVLFFGAAVFLLSRSKETLASDDFTKLVQGVKLSGAATISDILRSSGVFGAVLGAGLAKGCGKAAAALISLLVMLGCMPLAFPKFGEYLVNVITGRQEVELKPEKAEKSEKPAKPEKLAKPDKTRLRPRALDDELAELERLGQEIGVPEKRGLFERFADKPAAAADTVEIPLAGISTVMDLGPGGDAAAGELANGLAGDNSKRKKAQKAGDEAARAAIEKELENASYFKEDLQYKAPPLSCLLQPRTTAGPAKGEEEAIANRLLSTLDSFGVAVELVGRSRGPAVTRYELRPAEGVKISKITSLADDIALRLAATKVRIEAPIPGKPAVGVEVPNRVRAVVSLRELVDSDNYRTGTGKSKLTVALGKDIVGDFVCADLAKLPHLLIAGTTGSGKSVCMNTLILSLLYNASPEDVKLLMVDPKQVEFNVYSGIPHLLVPVVSDPLKAAGALGWAVNEMERRYTRISEQNVRDLDSYNNIAAMQDDLPHMPKIVIFIDELSDLMMVAPSDVEDSIQRLTQKGRAAGIHLVVATQRPSVDVITGVIKSNLPGRIALSVASQIDSRTIINASGAEQLLGNGDMLFSLNGGNNAVRVQGCFVSDPEVQKVVNFIKAEDATEGGYDDSVWEEIGSLAAAAARGKKKGGGADLSGDAADEDDPMLDPAIEVVVNAQMASTTMLQKKLKLGYARASRLVDLLEAKGIVGPPDGSRPRKVLMSHAQWQEYSAGEPTAPNGQ